MRKDGSLVEVEVIAVALKVDGDPSGYYAIYHDLSELHRQKQYYESLPRDEPGGDHDRRQRRHRHGLEPGGGAAPRVFQRGSARASVSTIS